MLKNVMIMLDRHEGVKRSLDDLAQGRVDVHSFNYRLGALFSRVHYVYYLLYEDGGVGPDNVRS